MSDTLKTIGQIVEGHGNNMLDKVGLLPEDIKLLAQQRLDACKQCDQYTLQSTCRICGCFMPAKTKTIRATCPHPNGPKWK